MPHFIQYTPNDFVAKFDGKKFMIFLAKLLIPLPVVILVKWEMFSKKSSLDLIMISVLAFLIILYYTIKILDRKPKLVISKIGIWTGKSGLIKWDEIWYYYVQGEKGKGGNYLYLHIKLKDEKTGYKIQIDGFDKSMDEIFSAIESYSEGYNIVALGYSDALSKF